MEETTSVVTEENKTDNVENEKKDPTLSEKKEQPEEDNAPASKNPFICV